MESTFFLRLFLWGLLLNSIITFNSFAQENEGGLPPSFNLDKTKRAKIAIPTYTTPAIPLQELQAQDEILDRGKFPFRFGYNFDVSINIKQEGALQELTDGSKLWTYKIECPNAISINLLYSQFKLPEGAKLYLYNKDASKILGAYTKRNNQDTEKFGTETTPGDVVTIEYIEPANPEFEGKLTIGVIVHGYRTHESTKALGAGSCNVNINCPEAAGWENQKRAVARIIMNGNTLCTGTLINNTRQDDKPYFITADHCIGDLDAVSKPDASGWVFYWNYESATCTGTSGPETQTTAGAIVRANNNQSDFALVELKSKPAASYNVFYVGWNRSNIPANGAVGIHHPAGDIKKFSKDNSTLVNDAGHHWKVPSWDIGVTEGGSSGSAIFDFDKRFLGQLTGGGSACGVPASSLWDSYGKFWYSWDQGGTIPQRRLKDWLDPDNTGAITFDGKNPGNITNNPPTVTITSPADNSGFEAPASITITATATDIDGTISKVEFYNGSIKIGEDLTAPFSFTWNSIPVGSYTIKAKAIDNGGATGTSAPIQISVMNYRSPENPVNTINGLEYSYYEGAWSWLPNFSILTPVKTDTSSYFNLNLRNREDDFAFQFKGYINIPTDGYYTFYTSSDDGSQLFIGSTLVVDNDGLHGTQERQGGIGLKAGKHAISVTFFERGGGQELVVSYSSPSISKRSIPDLALFRQGNNLPSISIISPTNNTSYTAPASITINASASDADGSISKIEFYSGSTKLGEDVSSPYSFTWNNVMSGSYTLTAKATDNTGAVTTSSSVVIQVNNPINQPPSVSIISPSNNTTLVAPANITINAIASDNDGLVNKVEFFNGSTKLGEVLSSPYTFTWNNIDAGTYLLSARVTDNDGATSTSSLIMITVTLDEDVCAAIPPYTSGTTYGPGNRVKNLGKIYECKPWPYSGWCSVAAWAYGPGEGMYWTDAWIETGSCSKSRETRSADDLLSNVTISPNPTENSIIIDFNNNNSTELTIQIYDALGNLVDARSVTSGDIIDLSHLSSGVYTLKIIAEGEVYTRKVVKK